MKPSILGYINYMLGYSQNKAKLARSTWPGSEYTREMRAGEVYSQNWLGAHGQAVNTQEKCAPAKFIRKTGSEHMARQ
jgi:hypothetical protein